MPYLSPAGVTYINNVESADLAYAVPANVGYAAAQVPAVAAVPFVKHVPTVSHVPVTRFEDHPVVLEKQLDVVKPAVQTRKFEVSCCSRRKFKALARIFESFRSCVSLGPPPSDPEAVLRHRGTRGGPASRLGRGRARAADFQDPEGTGRAPAVLPPTVRRHLQLCTLDDRSAVPFVRRPQLERGERRRGEPGLP